MRRQFPALFVFVAWLLSLPTPALAQAPHPVLDAPGFQSNRDYFSEMPFEHFDSLSGNLVLSFTDLVLPGNGGRELRFERTYNSKTRKWSFGIAGVVLHIGDPAPPSELPLDYTQQTGAPALYMSDGGVRNLAWSVQPDVNVPSTFNQAISSDFWLFDRTSTPRQLLIPNGDKCLYEEDGSPSALRVRRCFDSFNNEVEFEWLSSPPRLLVTQHLSPSTERLITVTFDPTSPDPSGPTRVMPLSLEFDGRIWAYIPDGSHRLSEVTPPAGVPHWFFGYDQTFGTLNSVTTPQGGVITYIYENQEYVGPDPPAQHFTLVIRERSTSGATWSYAYELDALGLSGETTITTPSGRIRYEYRPGNLPPDYTVFDGVAGLVLLSRRIVEKPVGTGWAELDREEREYTWLPVITGDNFGFGTLELKKRTIKRDGGLTPFVTTLNYGLANFGDYHHPNDIVEAGTATGSRVTDIEFRAPTSTPYLLALPTSEDVTATSETFSGAISKVWTYDTNGFRTSETTDGITTAFTPDTYGNVKAVTKGNGKTTQFQYKYGQVKATYTPEYPITREINPDGTVASETRAGRTTTFLYDDLGRLTETHPPGTNPTVISYEYGGDPRVVRTTRGPLVVTTTLDEFGRVIGTENNLGVKTTTTYDADGRVIYQGYPFKQGVGHEDIGTTIEYDALGRVTVRTNPGDPVGSSSTTTYGPNGVVTIVAAENPPRTTVQGWVGFGSPDQAQLATVVDALAHEWRYTYHLNGTLTSVTDGGLTRTWSIGAHNLVEWERHPESGQTSYTLYDDAGLLVTKVDANGTTTTFEYDGNDRVKKITAGTQVTNITYEPGSDNRQYAGKTGTSQYFFYDSVTGRRYAQQDTIDGKTFTTQFGYDGDDNLTAILYPSGRLVQVDLNAAGQPTKVYEPAAGRDYALGVIYHPSGGVLSYTSANNTTTNIAYDQFRYWVQTIDSGPVHLTYSGYDGVGNPHTIGDSRAGFGQTLDYDVLDRLKYASGAYGTATYDYDPHGNRISNAYQDYQYETNPNTYRLSNQGGVGFVYDFNGNAKTAGLATYTFTPQNQIATATVPGVNLTYAYDADAARVKKADGTSTTYYIHGLGGELLTEWKDPGTSNGRIRDYVYLGTRLLSAVTRNSSADPSVPNLSPTQTHRFATSWQVPTGAGDSPSLFSTTTAARTSSHPDMPRAGIRVGVQNVGWTDTMTAGPLFGSNPEHPKQADLFVEFEVERYPHETESDAEWLSVDGGATSTDDLRLYLKPGGTMVLKHDDGRTTPQTLWTSPVVGHSRHTLELRFEYSSSGPSYPLPNPVWDNLTSWARVYFDGALVATYGAGEGGTYNNSETTPRGLDSTVGTATFGSAKLKSPGPANGLLMNVSRFGLDAALNHGDSLGHYDPTWRTTLLEAAGPGTYSQWTGGQPDWRARSANYAGGNINQWATSNVSGQKISYLMESMASRGITGTIGAVIVGVRMGSTVSANTRAFIRRNGVDTTLTDMVLATANFKWYRVTASGWSPTDTVEIGVTCGDNTTNSLAAVAMVVEHNTPEPAPLTDTTAQVVKVPYVGNGGAQTVDLGTDKVPTVLFVIPATGANNVEPMWWWDSRLGAAPMSESVTSFSSIWPQKGKFHVVHFATGNSYNANGVSYVAIALFDPAGRFVIPFAVSKPTLDDDYTHFLHYPESGDPAPDFTPDFVFGGIASINGSDAARTSLYRGPGHVGDLTAKLGLSTPAASEADRIQALGAGTVQFGTLVGYGQGDEAFWAGRVSDGVSSTRLMAVTSYVGNGSSSRNIPLSLNGTAPDFTILVPTNATAKAYRVAGDTTGRNTVTGNALANSITALGADQITVGLALNVANVTYDVWVIRAGTVTP